MSVLLGFLYAAACIAGASLEKNGYLANPNAGAFWKGIGLWVCFGTAVFLLWTWEDSNRKESRGEDSSHPKTSRQGIVWIKAQREHGVTVQRANTAVRFFALWAVLCLIDLVSLLAVYPGFFVYDASEELAMVQSRAFTTHHPLLHVLLMGGVILAVHKVTTSWNAGIFVYILLQMLVINAAFTYVLADLCGRAEWRNPHSYSHAGDGKDDEAGNRSCAGFGKGAHLVGFLWLAFCPTVTMFVLCSCKDGLFAASLLVMTVELRHLLTDPAVPGNENRIEGEERRQNKVLLTEKRKHIVLFLASASLMMLFRNNGVYAYAVFLVVLLAAVLIRGINDSNNGWIRILLICVIPLVIYFGISKGLAAAVHATSNESQEILTVPIMQLGRTWRSDRDGFTGEEKELMAELVTPADEPVPGSEGVSEDGRNPSEQSVDAASGWDAYNPVLSDQLKLHFRSDVYRSDKVAFWKMYCHQLKAHPMTFLNAWLMTSYGFWYPEAVIDCYRGNTVYTFTYGDSSYFGYETEEPGTRESLIPALDGWYRFLSLDVRAQKIPVLHLFLSPGMMAWIFAFLLFDLWRRGEGRRLLVYLPTFLVWLTVLLGPCTLPRYVVYLWFEFPLMLGELCPGGSGRIRASAYINEQEVIQLSESGGQQMTAE